MLSYTDLLRVSHADAVDDADNVESIVLYMQWQVMAKEIVVISPMHHKEDTASILSKTNFMLCQYAKVNFGRDCDHDRWLNILEQYNGVK
jgi:hypothetical protein